MISGIVQPGDIRNTKRTPSAMSLGRSISSAGTWPLMKSDMSVSTNPGHSAVDLICTDASSLRIASV